MTKSSYEIKLTYTTRNCRISCRFSCAKQSAGIPEDLPEDVVRRELFLRILSPQEYPQLTITFAEAFPAEDFGIFMTTFPADLPADLINF